LFDEIEALLEVGVDIPQMSGDLRKGKVEFH
jgi:hypothetical protein